MNTWSIFKTLTRKQQAYLYIFLLWRFLRPTLDPMATYRTEIAKRACNANAHRANELLRVKLRRRSHFAQRPSSRMRAKFKKLSGRGIPAVSGRNVDKFKRVGLQVEANPSRIVFPDGATAYEPLPRMLWKPTDGIARDSYRYLHAEVGKLHARQMRRFALGFLREDEK